MLPRLLSLLPLLFVCSFNALAQAYEPGLLVRANGDTLRGEIENGFWDEPPAFIRFRSTAASPSELFKPHQLRAVRFTAGRYFRYEGLPIDHAAETRSNRLARGYRPLIRIDSLLAEVLVEGAVSLLRVASPGSVHFLLQSPTQPILDLSERRYLSQTPDGTWAVTNGNNYRSQLAIYFNSCPAAAGAAQKAAFSGEGLGAVVQAYNEQCGPAHQAGRSWLAQSKPRRSVALQGGLLAGGRYANLRNGFDDCYDCGIRPFGGLYADLFLPNRQYALYGELSASPFSGSGTQYSLSSTTGMEAYSDYTYRVLLGTLRFGIRYFIPLPREQQLLVGLGYEFNSVVLTRIRTVSGPPVTFQGEGRYSLPAALPNIGVGWRSNRLTVGVDGQTYDDFGDTKLSTLVGRNFVVRASVAYRLGRNPDVAKPPAPVRP